MPRGGARPGTGPKKGSKHQATLDRESAESRYRGYWQAKYDALMDAQYLSAVGETIMVHRDKGGRYKVLESAEEIQAHANLGDILEIKVKQANSSAQMDVLNRILGKPQEPPQTLNVNLDLDAKIIAALGKARSRVKP